jgi:hypothetical protein
MAEKIVISKDYIESELTCTISGRSFDENSILGIRISKEKKGIKNTFNVLPGLVEHLEFLEDQKKRTKFNIFLPVYINEMHYNKVHNLIKKAILKISDCSNVNDYNPMMVTEVMPILIKAVLMQIIEEFDLDRRLVKVYVHLILLYAMLCKIEKIEVDCSKELNKINYPDLGDLILNTIMNDKSLNQDIFKELFVRSVYYQIKEGLYIEEYKQIMTSYNENDQKAIIDKFLPKIGSKLLMFHYNITRYLMQHRKIIYESYGVIIECEMDKLCNDIVNLKTTRSFVDMCKIIEYNQFVIDGKFSNMSVYEFLAECSKDAYNKQYIKSR